MLYLISLNESAFSSDPLSKHNEIAERPCYFRMNSCLFIIIFNANNPSF